MHRRPLTPSLPGRHRPRRTHDPRGLVVALTLALLAGLAVLGGPGATLPAHADPTAGITTVSADDDTITVSGTAAPGDSVAVLRYGAAEEPVVDDRAPRGTVTADADGRFTASFTRSADDTEAYYGSYLAVVDGEPVGTDHHVDDVRQTPIADFDYPTASSKKGLQVQMTDDAEELGNQHAGINMAFDQLMQLDDEGNGATIPFVSGGRTFFFDKAAVEAQDRLIKPLSDNGQIVNLILLVYRSSDPNSAAPVLIHPDADPAGGPVFAFNTATAEGVAHYTAAMEFVTQRYTRDDQRYGRAVGFIVGNEIDAQWTWQNMGDKPLAEFLRDYERALRITHQAAIAAYGQARTYTSLTHCWTTVCGANPEESAPTRYYPVRDVVDGLNAITKAHGDYGWYLAHHPYPENLFDPAFWNDTTATGDVETTPRITFKNIELLPDYLDRSELRYDGQPRRVILSEQGCNTADDSAEAQRLQAACYALAYYKIRFLDSIDAFILHRHVDYKTEGGLRLGLWSWDDDRPEDSSPDQRKISYDVFRYIDTERSLEVTDFALDVIGIDDWSELVPGWDPEQLAQRRLPTALGAGTVARPTRTTVINDFTDGTQGWRVSDNATAVTATDGRLAVRFDALATLWRGTDVVLPAPLDATGAAALTLRLTVPAAPEVGSRQAKIKTYDSSGVEIGEGVAALSDTGQTQSVSVDLSSWSARDRIARIKVWVRGSTNADWEGSFTVDDVALAGGLAGGATTTNLEFAATADAGEVGGTATITVTNHDLRPARASVRVVACDGVGLDPATFALGGLAVGEQTRFTATITEYDPAAATPLLCLTVQGARFTVPLSVPPPTPVTVYDFDDGTVQGWRAGQNVASVAAVTSFLNAPGGPQGGSYALDATATPGPATAPKTVAVAPATPLDLSAAAEVVAFVDSYGGVPGATGYEVTLTLASGSDERTVVTAYRPDAWNEVALDVEGWSGRASVDRIEISVRALGTDFSPWDPHLQVDSVGYLTAARQPTVATAGPSVFSR